MSIQNLHDFSFNGHSLSELGAVIAKKPTHIVGIRDIDATKIQYHSGNAFTDNGRYENVEIKHKIRAVPSFCGLTFEAFCRRLTEWLYTENFEPKIYRDTYNLGYYRKGICTQIGEIVSVHKKVYETEITFDFDPFLYADNGIMPKLYESANGTIIETLYNPEKWASCPTIKIIGTGIYTLAVNNVEITATVANSLTIDKSQEDVFDDNGNSANDKINGYALPYLKAGTNTIFLSRTEGSGEFSLEIVPNWRRI